jgi:hypothetical protein
MRGIILGLFFLLGLSLNAQVSATGYFNNGAKEFIQSELKKAIATVDEGLKKFPNDEQLNALKKKLKEEEEKKKQQNKDQNKKDQNKENKDKQDQKDKQNQDDKNEDKKEGDKKDSDKNKEEEEKKKQEQKDKENQNKNGDKDKEKEKQKGQPQPVKMSPQQIKQLLETMNNEENKTQKKVNAQKAVGKKTKQEKDW